MDDVVSDDYRSWRWGKQSSAQHSPDAAERAERAKFDAEYTQAKIDLAVARANYRNHRENHRKEISADPWNREYARILAWTRKGETTGPRGATDISQLECPKGWPSGVDPDAATKEVIDKHYRYAFEPDENERDE